MFPVVKFLCSLLKPFHFSPAVESFHQPTSSVSYSTSHDGSIPEQVGRGTWLYEDLNHRCHVMSFFGTSGVNLGTPCYNSMQFTCWVMNCWEWPHLSASPLLQHPSPMDERGKTHEKPLLQPSSKIQVDGDVVPINQQNLSFWELFKPSILGRWLTLVYTFIPIDCRQFFPWLVNPLFYFLSCSFFLCGFAWSWKAWYVLIISFKRESDDQPESTFKEIHWKIDQPCSWSLITITEILFSQWLLASRLIYER